ncbi:uncharacterized protein LOC106870695 [Octopus bimaculoides]|uniref:Uncharacterized protein n=1 Tax=Octopus bimaculoides TaxID=37653 RepID=A0A0L8HID9_OCTBM|nr:uncharacterized protein LOC106870695 [Octopus bimaculoides]|eukprot:XP_014772344.1 PREDICTED: uncharacterized protein LOC106870695 [Octopus bimaculoides]
MLVRHMYSGLTLTGAIHFFLGTFCFVASMVGFKTKRWYGRRMFHPSYYYGINTEELPIISATFGCIASLWVISVGIFGILAGRKMSSPLLSQKLKITYMILNILSASVFAHTGIGAFTSLGVWIRYHHPTRLYILFSLAAFAMFVDFVLSIVSSSLLCCCSINEQSVWVSTNQGTEFLNPVSDMNVAPAIKYPPNVVVEAYDPAQEKKRIEMEYS